MKAEEILLPDPMEIPTKSVAPVITRLSSHQTALAARLIRVSTEPIQGESLPDPEDELLTTADAAKLLNVSEDCLDRRSGRLPLIDTLVPCHVSSAFLLSYLDPHFLCSSFAGLHTLGVGK